MSEDEEIHPEEIRPEKKDIVYLAETNFRNSRKRFGIKRDDRRRHMYLIGKTGMGKSTAMENMIIQDIINGEGVALVDPHGDFAEKLLDYIPSHRINDVIYFNPADIEFPIAFNVMEAVSPEHKHLVASGLVGVFKKLWADSWGPRLEYVLRNAILALLDYPDSTLLGVMRILADKDYRKKVVAKIQDPVVRSFWVDEYSKYPPALQAEATAPIQNKVGQFLSTALIRNVVGQVKSTIDLREIMDNKKVLIMNLSKGRIGEDASALLGAMMITKIQLAAMSRVNIPEEERQDFYLYVDEFQNFATESFANILSEARKYRLDLIIAHQYIEQLDEKVTAAVFGNVGTMMTFRIGAADAEFLVREFEPYLTAEDLVNLTKFDVYMKLMINGVASNPFSATTLGPMMVTVKTENRPKIIASTHERYCYPRDVVEDKISRWSGMTDEEPLIAPSSHSIAPAAKIEAQAPVKAGDNLPASPSAPTQTTVPTPVEPNPERTSFKANCYECGKLTDINFKPDGIRPIYCQDCFTKMRGRSSKKMDDDVEAVIEEIAETPVERVSLNQVLRQSPVMFKQNSGRPQQAPRQNREPRRDQQPRPHAPTPLPRKTEQSAEPEPTSRPAQALPVVPSATPTPPRPIAPVTPVTQPEAIIQPSISLTQLKPGQVVKFKQ